MPSTQQKAKELWGVVTRIDQVNRAIDVRTHGAITTFDVHRESVITLRGERVKLRLIQARDPVRVLYREDGAALVAEIIEIQPLHPAAERVAGVALLRQSG